MRHQVKAIALLVFILVNTSLPFSPSAFAVSMESEYWPTEGWRTSTPEGQGMSSVKLQEMMDQIKSRSLFIHGVVVVRHGYLVWERYPDPAYDVNTTHLLYSVTKSFTSCLVGIALDKGLISNVSQRMVSFFPDRTIDDPDGRKQRVTLENLLMMRSGMKWDESSAPYTTPANDVYHINNDPDGLQYCLDLPMIAEPGAIWYYNTGSSHILSSVVQRATGMTTLEFARQNLFEPLGIRNVYWSKDRGGIYKGGFDLQLTPRDMAKFGYLYLNGGRWGSKQIVPAEWVRKSTSSLTRLDTNTGYGYQWWTLPGFNVFYAAGLYGQHIFVAPDADLVFVTTSAVSPSQHSQLLELFTDYVLTAVTDQGSQGGTQPGQATQDPQGIPGFPMTSLILGLIAASILLGLRKFLLSPSK